MAFLRDGEVTADDETAIPDNTSSPSRGGVKTREIQRPKLIPYAAHIEKRHETDGDVLFSEIEENRIPAQLHPEDEAHVIDETVAVIAAHVAVAAQSMSGV